MNHISVIVLFPVDPSERRKAIQYLIKNISAETWVDVQNEMKEKGSNWGVFHHHGFGMGVRNLLREGGFNWGPIDLDDIWVELIEEAIKKKFGKLPYKKKKRSKKSMNWK
jgi:hypothetical protein